MNIYLITIFIAFGINLNSCFCKDDNYFYYTYYNEKNNKDIVVNCSNKLLNTVEVPNWTSQAFYNASQNYTGWDLLEIESNPELEDEIQAYHAGFIEGYATRDQIWNYYWNNVDQIKSNASDLRNNASREYFKTNHEFIKSKIANTINDSYWHQVNLFYEQMHGLVDGYNNATAKMSKTSTQMLNYEDFLMINFLEEIMDLSVAYIIKNSSKLNKTMNDKYRHNSHRSSNGAHCSALIKLLPGNSDVFVAHDTWTSYNQMNRILKRYKLAYRMSKKDTNLIPGMSVTLSSYPGTLGSIDDFYVMGSGIIALETTIEVYNMSLYKNVDPNNEVSETVRNIVANRLAKDGLSWMKHFSKNNSGTYNNQWMIVDMNKFKPGFDPEEGFLSVLEQAPGYIRPIISANEVKNLGDQTPHLLQHGYWASYNIPFYPEIYNVTNNYKVALNNSWYSYTECPRAKIFKRDQVKVTDLTSMLKLMRYNNYKKDSYSICDSCDPKPNACNAIASRCDLNPVEGKYASGVSHALFGATDSKITSFSLFSTGQILAVSGPTTDGLEPFSWKMAVNGSKTRHMGQPDTWDFHPIISGWITNTPVDDMINPTLPSSTSKPETSTKKNNSSPLPKPFSIIAYIFISVYLIFKGVF